MLASASNVIGAPGAQVLLLAESSGCLRQRETATPICLGVAPTAGQVLDRVSVVELVGITGAQLIGSERTGGMMRELARNFKFPRGET